MRQFDPLSAEAEYGELVAELIAFDQDSAFDLGSANDNASCIVVEMQRLGSEYNDLKIDSFDFVPDDAA